MSLHFDGGTGFSTGVCGEIRWVCFSAWLQGSGIRYFGCEWSVPLNNRTLRMKWKSMSNDAFTFHRRSYRFSSGSRPDVIATTLSESQCRASTRSLSYRLLLRLRSPCLPCEIPVAPCNYAPLSPRSSRISRRIRHTARKIRLLIRQSSSIEPDPKGNRVPRSKSTVCVARPRDTLDGYLCTTLLERQVPFSLQAHTARLLEAEGEHSSSTCG